LDKLQDVLQLIVEPCVYEQLFVVDLFCPIRLTKLCKYCE